jgi:hypothetical protein
MKSVLEKARRTLKPRREQIEDELEDVNLQLTDLEKGTAGRAHRHPECLYHNWTSWQYS